MRPFDMDSILRPGISQLPVQNSDIFTPKHLPYFGTKPYETVIQSPESLSTTLRQKQPGADSTSGYVTNYEAKRKPSRSVFAPSQIGFMEGIYHGENKTYLTADNRRQIAKKTGLSETQVKRWWQNRRQKDKNRLRDSLQSLNHFLPSMMYSCEPARTYRNPYITEGHGSLSNSLVHLTTARHSQFLLQNSSHNLITRT